MTERHPSPEDWILFHYGELPERGAAETHLRICAECQGAYDRLKGVLLAVEGWEAPQRDAEYGREVWRRLAPRLHETRRPEERRPLGRAALTWRHWAAMSAMAASLVMAFVLGRASRGPERATTAQDAAAPRERILLVAVGDHLERSQMVLIELQNAEPNGGVDMRAERAWAQELVPANRLYRQAAAQAGENGLALVLDDLERTLLEIATSPDELASSDFEELRERIEARGILFKVKVLGSRVRQRERAAVRAGRVAS
jgi:hypothetical protein